MIEIALVFFPLTLNMSLYPGENQITVIFIIYV